MTDFPVFTEIIELFGVEKCPVFPTSDSTFPISVRYRVFGHEKSRPGGRPGSSRLSVHHPGSKPATSDLLNRVMGISLRSTGLIPSPCNR